MFRLHEVVGERVDSIAELAYVLLAAFSPIVVCLPVMWAWGLVLVAFRVLTYDEFVTFFFLRSNRQR